MNKIGTSWTGNLFMFILGVMLLAGGVSALPATITVPTVIAAPGSDVTVPVQIENASNIGGILLDIRYGSSVLKYTGVDTAKITVDSVVEGREIKPGLTSIAVIDERGISGSGTLLILRFRVVGDEGSSTSVIPAILESYDQNAASIPIDTIGGSIKIISQAPTGADTPSITMEDLPPETRQTPLEVGVPICAGIITGLGWIVYRRKMNQD